MKHTKTYILEIRKAIVEELQKCEEHDGVIYHKTQNTANLINRILDGIIINLAKDKVDISDL